MSKKLLLFYIVLAEGYVTLAAEILAIRQLIPFVGNGTETIAIIISAVLMPLSIGYYVGGHAVQIARFRNKHLSIRRLLTRNVIIAGIILTFGLSYFSLILIFEAFHMLGVESRIMQTSLYSLLFLVYPTFLLGQTVPLVSNYFSKKRTSEVTGKMLFYSTTGSFLGSILSTLILMNSIGVNKTVIVTLLLLISILLVLNKRKFGKHLIFAAIIASVVFAFNRDSIFERFDIVEYNRYNVIAVTDNPEENSRMLRLNHSASSKYSSDPTKRFMYIQYIENQFIKPYQGDKPLEILVLGAGGFTLGIDDDTNQYTFVDIDPDLLSISEKYFLQQKLGPNKSFVPEPARAFLRADDKQYDLIVADTFSSVHVIPFQLLAREYYQQIKDALKPDGYVVINFIGNISFSDDYSVNYDNTLRTVYPLITRQIVGTYDAWDRQWDGNLLYIYRKSEYAKDIYTDNKNDYFWDR